MKDKPSSPFSQKLAAIKKENEERDKKLQSQHGVGFPSIIEAGKLALEDTPKRFPALVVKVISDYTLTINRGWDHNIKTGDRFLVYAIDPEELIDPETGESLGHLEIIRGTGVATHVQQKMTTIESDRHTTKGRTIRRQNAMFAGIGSEIIEEPEKQLLPFDLPELGDKVKPIN